MPAGKRQQSSDVHLLLPQAVRRCYEGRLRQEDVAQALGVHQSKVSKWATGTMRPTVEEISALEDACGRSRGFVLALAGLVTKAGVSEGLRELNELTRGGHYALAAERGGRADLSDVVRRSGRARPRRGATPPSRD